MQMRHENTRYGRMNRMRNNMMDRLRIMHKARHRLNLGLVRKMCIIITISNPLTRGRLRSPIEGKDKQVRTNRMHKWRYRCPIWRRI